MKRIALIPARGGSVGLPGKNMSLLSGTPLIGHAILAAKSSGRIDDAVVSSDDPRILRYAASQGVRTLIRPPHLATNEAVMGDVISDWLETDSLVGQDDIFCLLQPTSPLRVARDIDSAMARYEENRPEMLLSAVRVESERLKSFFRTESGQLAPVSERFSPFSNRQSLPEVFKPNGAIYICGVNVFREVGGFPLGKVELFEMSESSSLDVDCLDDLRKAEELHINQLGIRSHASYDSH